MIEMPLEKQETIKHLALNKSKITLREMLGLFGFMDDIEAEKMMKQIQDAKRG